MNQTTTTIKEHQMKLNNSPFESIKSGSKTIELRLYDEKRRLLKTGDLIEFTNLITGEKLKVKVTNLYIYDNFCQLYKNFNKTKLGYSKGETAKPEDMLNYYSIEEQKRYGVIGIELALLNKPIKEIIYNEDNLSMKDINDIVKRAKLLIMNSKNEILLCHCENDYFFLGGHLEKNESDNTCLKREILEETGVNINLKDIDHILTIKYFNKNYHSKGMNTLTIANYYSCKYDLIPNIKKVSLTKEEEIGNFKIEYINSKKVLKILKKSLKYTINKNVTEDTILVLSKFLKKEKKWQ